MSRHTFANESLDKTTVRTSVAFAYVDGLDDGHESDHSVESQGSDLGRNESVVRRFGNILTKKPATQISTTPAQVMSNLPRR